MRIGWLMLCFYGLSSSVAHASTLIEIGSSSCSGSQSISSIGGLSFSCSGDFSLSSGRLSSDTSITLRSLGSLSLDALTLSAPSVTLSAQSINIGKNVQILPVPTIAINPGTDITVGARPLLVPTDSNAPVPRDSISLISRANRELLSGALVPRYSGGDITLSRAATIATGSGTLSAKYLNIRPGSNISLGSGIVVPTAPTLNPGGNITLAPGGSINTMSGASIASVPLPASSYMLMTGLLALVSVSRRSFFGTANNSSLCGYRG